ncbi:hypothetical protein ACM66B_000704 [Microbotryomycetes sp. NB124-2]
MQSPWPPEASSSSSTALGHQWHQQQPSSGLAPGTTAAMRHPAHQSAHYQHPRAHIQSPVPQHAWQTMYPPHAPPEDVRHWSAPIETLAGSSSGAMMSHHDPRVMHDQQYVTHGHPGRPPLGQFHSFPPAPPLHQGAARASAQHSTSHASYHPYSPPGSSTSPKKQLLFINSSSNDPLVNKPKRKRISPEQLEHLLGLFNQTDAPNFDQREKVAQATGMTNREVQIWFQNRRAKVIRERERAIKLGKSPSEAGVPSPRSKSATSSAAAGLARYTADVTLEESHMGQARSESSVEPDQQGLTHSSQPITPSSFSASPSLALPPPPSTHAPTMMLPPTSSSSVPRLMPEARNPGSAGPTSRATFNRSIDLPSPSLPQFSPGMQAHRSPSGVLYSPSTYNPTSYFGIPSPSLSSSYNGSHLFTPNPGSAYSTSSSYFSHHEPGLYSPSTALSSPSGNFFRLSLDSPGCFSPRAAGGPAHLQNGMYYDRSPRPGEHSVHLAPIVSPGLWGSQHSSPHHLAPQQPQPGSGESYGPPRAAQGHKRSQSDTAVLSHTAMDGLPMQNVAGTSVAGSASLPNSPQDARRAVPATVEAAAPAFEETAAAMSAGGSSQNPALLSASSAGRPRSAHRRRAGPRPSSLSHISHSIKEETSPPPPESPTSVVGGVGLGMLAMAASGETGEDMDEDDEEREARQRYLATRKLSYTAGLVEVGISAQTPATSLAPVTDDVDMVRA